MALLDRVLANVSPAAALRRGVQLSEQGDLKQAFPLLVRAARAGIAEAEFRLGRCYMEGAGVPTSRVEGARWLERAANQGYVEAQARLATLSIYGLLSGSGMAAQESTRPRVCSPATKPPRRNSMSASNGRARRPRWFSRWPGGPGLHPDVGPGSLAEFGRGASLV